MLITTHKDGVFHLKPIGKNIDGLHKSPATYLEHALIRQLKTSQKIIIIVNQHDRCLYEFKATSSHQQNEWLRDFKSSIEKAAGSQASFRNSLVSCLLICLCSFSLWQPARKHQSRYKRRPPSTWFEFVNALSL
jgi:hypothetical protein